MQVKLNKVFKLSADMGFSVKTDSQLAPFAEMPDNDRLRLSLNELVEDYEIQEDMLDDLSSKLTDIKKKSFEIKILETGRSIGSMIELKELKSRGVDKLIDIPGEVKAKVKSLEAAIHAEQSYLSDLRKKSKETIVNEFGLLPNLNFRIVTSFSLTFFSAIFVFLGYVASTDERFFDKDFGYWSMLIGGLALIVTLNLLVIRIVQLLRFKVNKQKIIEDLAYKYMTKVEQNFESIEKKLREQIFNLERAVYSESCTDRAKECILEQKALINSVGNHFS